MKDLKGIRQLPNLLTLLNMLLGLSVLFFHIWQGERFRLYACSIILLAALLDVLDGKLARFLSAESKFGKQLDSFADFVSFGIAPLTILLTHGPIRSGGWLIYAAFGIYVMAAAWRLARFNLGDYAEYFVGLPITAAGFILTLVNLLLHFTSLLESQLTISLLVVVVVLLAVLMVSTKQIKRLW